MSFFLNTVCYINATFKSPIQECLFTKKTVSSRMLNACWIISLNCVQRSRTRRINSLQFEIAFSSLDVMQYAILWLLRFYWCCVIYFLLLYFFIARITIKLTFLKSFLLIRTSCKYPRILRITLLDIFNFFFNFLLISTETSLISPLITYLILVS